MRSGCFGLVLQSETFISISLFLVKGLDGCIPAELACRDPQKSARQTLLQTHQSKTVYRGSVLHFSAKFLGGSSGSSIPARLPCTEKALQLVPYQSLASTHRFEVHFLVLDESASHDHLVTKEEHKV